MSLSPLVGERTDLLLALQAVNESVRGSLIDSLDREAVLALTEVALNVILGTIPVDSGQLSRLRRHREDLHELTGGRTSLTRRSEILRSSGVAKSFLDPFATSIVGKKGSSSRYGGR